MKTCTTYDSRVIKLRKFLTENPVVMLCVDKSSDLAIITEESYHKKLGELFLENPNIEKISKFSLSDTITEYNQLRQKYMDAYLSNETIKSLNCNHSICDLYRMLKLHKNCHPLRPIATGFNSLVCDSERYLANLMKPLLEKCKYLIDIPKMFKSRTKLESFDYDPKIHAVVSYDCKSLFTRVKVFGVISWILDELIKNPRIFFKETHSGQLVFT